MLGNLEEEVCDLLFMSIFNLLTSVILPSAFSPPRFALCH